ncbi:MAG: FG-GAP repeat domain-containing protein, partial [Planctomycetota bacterium]
TASAAPAQVRFDTPVNFPSGSGPHSIVAADFDQDGFTDLGIALRGTNQVNVMLNDGLGGYTSLGTFGVGSQPLDVDSADLDGVNGPDLLVADLFDDTVTVLLNNGAGSFGAGVALPVGVRPISLHCADFNQDGLPDWVVANRSSETITVYFNDLASPGSFIGRIDFATGVLNPRSLAVGDFDLQNGPDIAVSGFESNDVVLLQNNGAGLFSVATSLAVGTNPRSVIFSDVDTDGALDLVVANRVSGDVMVFMNDGAGGFPASTSFPAGVTPRDVVTTDVDLDGKFDLVVTNETTNLISVLLGDGAGGFGAATPVTVGGTSPMNTVQPVDVNGDQRVDLVTANRDNATISVLNNKTLTLLFRRLKRGRFVNFRASGGFPGDTVHFFGSNTGIGVGNSFPQFGGLTLDILNEIKFGKSNVKPNSIARLRARVPARLAPGTQVFLQVVEERGVGGVDSVKSRVVTATIRP